MSISVRRAMPSDCKDVLALRKRLYLESAQAEKNGHLTPLQEWRAFYDVLGVLLDQFAVTLIASDDGKPVGLLTVAAGGLVGFYSETSVSVTWIYVDPKYRDGAVLLSLIRTAEQAISVDQNTTIHATIRADNAAVLGAASKLGYTPVALIMEKKHGRASRRQPVKEVHQAGGQHPTGGTTGPPDRP